MPSAMRSEELGASRRLWPAHPPGGEPSAHVAGRAALARRLPALAGAALLVGDVLTVIGAFLLAYWAR